MFISIPGNVDERTPRVTLPFLSGKATYYGIKESLSEVGRITENVFFFKDG